MAIREKSQLFSARSSIHRTKFARKTLIMARRRASTPGTATAVAPRGTSANDRTLYTHNLWLNYLKPVSLGLVFSSNALRAAQIELPLQSADAQRALEALTIPKPLSDDEDADHENPPRTLRSTARVPDRVPRLEARSPRVLSSQRPSPDVRRPGTRPRLQPCRRSTRTARRAAA